MKDYTAAVPIDHHQEADALAFLHSMIPSTETMIEDELQREGGFKFALVLEVELEKFSKKWQM
jgi:nanoRNase/pAp phosphatase (c-di-AMP/oligoRNAs hydrolase)